MSRLSQWDTEGDEALIGGWSLMGPAAAEVMSLAGLDWVALDAQHGLHDDRSVVDTLHLVSRDQADVIVRVPSNDAAWIGRVLDAGARGVIVPMVESPADAERAARACRYPPVGVRSWGQFSGLWGRAEVPAQTANRDVVCAVMVESEAGLHDVEAIAAVEGIDMIFVGPFDLSIALGTSVAQLLDADAAGELGAIVEACRKYDVTPGAFAGTLERAARLSELGFSFLAVATDAELLRAAADALQPAWRDGHDVTKQ